MGTNTKSIQPHKRRNALSNVLYPLDDPARVSSRTQPKVSQFEYLISEPHYRVSELTHGDSDPSYVPPEPLYATYGYGSSQSNKVHGFGGPAPFPVPNPPPVYQQNSAYVPDSEPLFSQLYYQLTDVNVITPVPMLYPDLSQLSYYNETLAAATIPSDHSALGAVLNRYEVALAAIQEIAKKAEQQFNLNAWVTHVRREAGTTDQVRRKKFNFQEIIELIDVAQAKKYAPRTAQVLVYILFQRRTRRLRQRFLDKIQLIKRILRGSESRFCGFSWSRRLWFFLHGSHPPRSESWLPYSPEFGGAQTSLS